MAEFVTGSIRNFFGLMRQTCAQAPLTSSLMRHLGYIVLCVDVR